MKPGPDIDTVIYGTGADVIEDTKFTVLDHSIQ